MLLVTTCLEVQRTVQVKGHMKSSRVSHRNNQRRLQSSRSHSVTDRLGGLLDFYFLQKGSDEERDVRNAAPS